MSTLRTRRVAAFAGTAVALSLALTGCTSLFGPNDADRDEEGNVTEEADIDIFSLKLGDCMPGDAVADGEQDSAAVVPCDGPHGYEVYYEFDLNHDEYPGSDAIQTEVEAQCLPAFNDFVGMDYYDSSLDITWYEPTQQSWDQAGDRKVQCLVLDPAGDVTGTLKGAAR